MVIGVRVVVDVGVGVAPGSSVEVGVGVGVGVEVGVGVGVGVEVGVGVGVRVGPSANSLLHTPPTVPAYITRGRLALTTSLVTSRFPKPSLKGVQVPPPSEETNTPLPTVPA